MKANEAPEKIYRTTTYLDNDKGKTLWKPKPVAGAENIEYTRTDAFIEKAVKHIDGLIEFLNEYGHQLKKERIIEDFKKYMED